MFLAKPILLNDFLSELDWLHVVLSAFYIMTASAIIIFEADIKRGWVRVTFYANNVAYSIVNVKRWVVNLYPIAYH